MSGYCWRSSCLMIHSQSISFTVCFVLHLNVYSGFEALTFYLVFVYIFGYLRHYFRYILIESPSSNKSGKKPGLELVLCITFISVHRVIVHLRWEAHKSNIYSSKRECSRTSENHKGSSNIILYVVGVVKFIICFVHIL